MTLKPALFVHIPGTVEPGFLAALGAAYGERGCVRVPRAAPDLVGLLDGEPPALLHGHAPLHAWAALRPRLRGFTLLRHPVARVQALFRTIRAEPAELLARRGLQPGFSFDAFMDAPGRGIREAIGNGMCRMLCADPDFTSPGGPRFEDPEAAPGLLAQAVDSLGTLAFGLAEQMPASLALLGQALGIPYALAVAAEPEAEAGAEAEPWNVSRIAARNPLDMALYDAACRLFRARLAEPPPMPAWHDPRSLFAPAAGQWIDIAAIGGRQGFYLQDPHGVAWLDPETGSRLHFRAPRAEGTLALRLLGVREGYPMGRIRLRLDGAEIGFDVGERDGRWATLTTARLSFAERAHRLELLAPYAVPARALVPGGGDMRRLSVGLAKVLFAG